MSAAPSLSLERSLSSSVLASTSSYDSLIWYRKPVSFYAALSVRRPVAVLIGAWSVVLILTLLVSNQFGLSEQTDYDWMIRTDDVVKKANAYREVRKDAAKSSVVPTRESRSEQQTLTLLYEADDGNLFTAERLRAIHNFESVIFNDHDGRKFAQFCQLQLGSKTQKCKEPYSVLNAFTESANNTMRPLAGKGGAPCDFDCFVDAPNARLETVLASETAWLAIRGSFGKDLTADNVNTRWGMSSYNLGLPLPGYSNPEETFVEQRKEGDKLLSHISETWRKTMKMEWNALAQMFRSPYQKEARLKSVDGKDVGVKVRWWSLALQREEWESLSFTDLNWVVLCVLCVGAYTYVHTRSALLMVTCILQILLSIFVALFFFRIVFQVTFFSFVNFLIVFVVLGVGADDVFVFFDTYSQSEFHLESEGIVNPTMHHRIVFTAHTASKAIFTTSFTTAAAFLATAASPLMPLQSFGIYSALVVLSLFFINCIVVPPTLVLYARNFQARPCLEACGYFWCGICNGLCGAFGLNPLPVAAGEEPRTLKSMAPGKLFRCFCPPCAVLDMDGPGLSANIAAIPIVGSIYAMTCWTPKSHASAPDVELSASSSATAKSPPNEQKMDRAEETATATATAKPKLRAIERFFMGPFYNLLSGNAKYAILVAFAAVFLVGIIGWSKLAPPTDPEQWFPNTHMFQQYSEIGESKQFYTSGAEDASGSALLVSAVWGIKDMDTKGTKRWNPADLGKVVFTKDFSLSSKESQQHFFKVARAMRDVKCTLKACNGGKLTTSGMDAVKNVLGDEDASGKLTHGFYAWSSWKNDTNAMCGASKCTSFTPENPLTGDEFLHELCSFNARSGTAGRYPGLLVFDLGSTDGKCPPRSSAAPKLQVAALRVVTSLTHPQPPQTFVDIRDEWGAFEAKMNSDSSAPVSMRSMFVTSTDIFWMWSVTTGALTQGVYLGMSICFPLVYVVLALSTTNALLALYATFTILGIVASVLGVGAYYIMGWPLGTAEAVAAVIVIGLSVDYCVHLANAYMESTSSTKADRMKDALGHMGICVTAGAFTTTSSAVWLFACILLFFQKFAFLMCWTIFMSFCWSILFFPALVLVAMPEGNFGDLTPVFEKLKKLCGGGGGGGR